jgi:dihydroxyacid dehydratase/phosphogluconate dehydratase
VPGQDAIRSRDNPIKPEGAMAVLRGNLAPRGAVIKHVGGISRYCNTLAGPSCSSRLRI